MRTEIRISGFGGQGIGLAGFILGKAAAIYDGKEAVVTQSYGPEARGGASNANIVIADRRIDYPFVQAPDVLVTLSQEAYARFRQNAKNGAWVLIDSGLVTPLKGDAPLQIPATQLAEGLGRRIVANIVMLGFLTGCLDLVSHPAMEAAIQSSVPPRFADLNLKAFTAGYDYAKGKSGPGQPEGQAAGCDRAP